MTSARGNREQDPKKKDKDSGEKKTSDRESGSPVKRSLYRFYGKYLAPQGEDGHYTIVHDVLVAIIVVLVIISVIFLYTRTWPPVVVVESGSMQHDTQTSSLGVIDTGDIVMVKKVNSVEDVTTWAEGKEKDYETYGEYGDVIIYDKNGKGGTPVIHRAIVYLRHNETVSGIHYFDIPEWNIYHNQTIIYEVPELQLKINYTPHRGHDGFLTKGDNRVTNKQVDQEAGILDIDHKVVEQVTFDWVLGVARGEIPWFGLIKLWLNDNDGWDESPDNSKTNLKVSLVLLIGVPVALNIMYYAFAAKYGTLEEEEKNTKGKGKTRDGGKGKRKSKEEEKDSMTKRERKLSSRMDKVRIGRK